MSALNTQVTPQVHEPQEIPGEEKNVVRDQLMAASIGNVEWLRLGMKAANSQAKADGYGFSALHMAAIHCRLQCLRVLLEDCGMDVDTPSSYGWRALHLVLNQKTGRRTMPCLRYLLQRGADVNVRSKNLTTPLHRAAMEGLRDCIAVLVEAGADVYATDFEGNKPIDLCHLCCHRSSARLLQSAMWKKDKEDDAQRLRRMEKIRQDIEDTEKEASQLRTQIPSSNSTRTKDLADKLKKTILKMETLPKSKTAEKSYCKGAEQKVKTGKNGKERSIVQSPKSSIQEVHDESRPASENTIWNTSTNPYMPPALSIDRVPALWQGKYSDDVTKKDINSKVLLIKDEQGQLQIQTEHGQVFFLPGLPYRVIERNLFPSRGPQDRIQKPRDFKATHVFDVPRKQQPIESQKPASEISFHLRRNLDSKFKKTHGATAHLTAGLVK